jgi:hypothetical protein
MDSVFVKLGCQLVDNDSTLTKQTGKYL